MKVIALMVIAVACVTGFIIAQLTKHNDGSGWLLVIAVFAVWAIDAERKA